MDSENSVQPKRILALWLSSVLVLWTGAHALNAWVLVMDESTPGRRFAWWTGAKIIAWLLPTWVLLRGSSAASARWLGLTTFKGLGLAVLCSVAWIGFQEAGLALHLPLFSRPPSDLSLYSLAGSLLIAPCFEELMFRGAMLRTLKNVGYARGVSIVLSALAFAALHVPGWLARRGLDPAIAGGFLSMVFFGVAAGLLAWRAPSLWAPILFHFANNFWSTGALAYLLSA
ncbi:MAG TPA: CPBP family intramembrane glutamic endopeptidase [Polyangiales bacterium]|nr:CPBP family intramembrane glutamic endopeptidase [Polyangiales bacterium]